MTDNTPFRTVLRGYDPAQVDQVVHELAAATEAARQETAQHAVAVSKLESGHAELRNLLGARDAHIAALEEAQRHAAAPTFADLGERIGHILTLADEEAAQIRATAAQEADGTRQAAAAAATAARADADRYAEDVRTRTDAEAARILETARSKADEILGDADREASARREEAEAVYEHQRAKAAAAAADFETTLAGRRDKAAAEFAAQLSHHEASLAAVQERAAALAAESDRAHQDARSEATAHLEQARTEAGALVASAREQADRIKRDSERELAAATSRRDAITAQLTNVRQMLATLGGAAMINPLGEAHEAPEAAAPVVHADPVEAEVADAEAAVIDEPSDLSDEAAQVEADPDEVVELAGAADDETPQADAAPTDKPGAARSGVAALKAALVASE